MTEYAKALRTIGYEGGMSLEAMPDPAKDWENEARENFRVLRSVFG
jgi:sugar phosphate isomerase/epimerase